MALGFQQLAYQYGAYQQEASTISAFQCGGFQTSAFQTVCGDTKKQGAGSYDDERKRKKYIVRRGNQLLVFYNEADALMAMPQAEVKVKQYPAKKKAKVVQESDYIPTVSKAPDFSLELDRIASFALAYQRQAEYQSMLNKSRYEALIAFYDGLQRQEDEEVELLLMAS